MSYGVKWRLFYTDELGRDKRVDILKKDYTGEIQEVTGATHSPVHISMQNQGDEKFETIKGTEIEVKLFSEVQFGDTFNHFSDDTFYVLDDSTNVFLRKCTVNSVDGITVQSSYEFTNTDIAWAESSVNVLRNGNVVVHSSGSIGSDVVRLFLFDSDLNFIRSQTLSGFDRTPKIFIDYDNSIYIPRRPAGGKFIVTKYNSDLTEILWTSSGGSHSSGDIFVGGNVTYSHVVMQVEKTGGDIVLFFDKETGALYREDSRAYNLNVVDGASIDNYTSGNFILSDQTNRYYVYDKNSIQIDSGTFPNEIRLARNLSGTNDDQTILLGYNDGARYFDTDYSLIKTFFANSLQSSGKIGWTTDRNEVLIHFVRTSNNTGSIYKINLSSETISNLSSYVSINPLSGYGFGMAAENWQLQDNGTDIDFSEIAEGSDTDYKIEVYEDDGL